MSKRENPFKPRRPLVPRHAARASARAMLDAREVETEDRRLEVTIAWGENAILHVAHLEIGAPFTLGQEEDASFVVGREALGLSVLPLVTFEGERATIAVPAGASLTRSSEVERDFIRGEDETCAPEARSVALEPGVTYRVRHRAFVFTLREVKAGRRVKRARPLDWAFFGHVMAVGLVFAGFVLLSSLTPRSAGALSPPALDASHRYVRHAILKAEQRDEAPPPLVQASREQTIAHPASPNDVTRLRVSSRPRAIDRTGGERPRETWRERASTSSVSATLRAVAAELPGTPSWVADGSLGGGTWPMTPGTPGGFGALDVIGAPRPPGAGTGTIGVKLERIGPPPGAPTRARLAARTALVPPPAPSVEMDARGGLEREIVRRVVRRNEAKVRFCYEQALQADAELAGRVELKFLISPSGAVQSATVLRTEVGREVGECIARAVRRISFPAPDGGIVAVSYSWTFRAR
jgi:hypothetical protein